MGRSLVKGQEATSTKNAIVEYSYLSGKRALSKVGKGMYVT
jgi:hypothetical protein